MNIQYSNWIQELDFIFHKLCVEIKPEIVKESAHFKVKRHRLVPSPKLSIKQNALPIGLKVGQNKGLSCT